MRKPATMALALLGTIVANLVIAGVAIAGNAAPDSAPAVPTGTATPTAMSAPTTSAAPVADDQFVAEVIGTNELFVVGRSICDSIGLPGVSHASLVGELGASRWGAAVAEILVTSAEVNLCPERRYVVATVAVHSEAPAPQARPAPSRAAPPARPAQPEPAPSPRPQPAPQADPAPSPKLQPTPRPDSEPSPTPTPDPEPSPTPQPEPTPAPQPEPSPQPEPEPEEPPSPTYYENCDAARAAGAAPLHRDDSGYRAELDRDDDGIACE